MLNIFKNPQVRQYFVVIIVNLSCVSIGASFVWPSPVLVKLTDSSQTILSEPITEEEGSWIVSIGFLTALIGSFMVVWTVERIGRKYTLIVFGLPKFVAGILFIYATEVWLILLGRALIGISQAAIFMVVPMYASEIASNEIRGSLGTILQIMSSLGVVIMLSTGPFISYVMVNVMFTCINVVTTIPLFLIPESPYYLFCKGKKTESLKVLKFYRGSDTMAAEELQQYEVNSDNVEKISNKDIVTNRLFLKSLFLVVMIGLGAQLVGFNSVSYYLQTILESTQTSVSPEISSVVIGLIQLLASIGTTFMTDKFGRKPIMTVTSVGMGIGMLLLGVFFKVTENQPASGFMNFLPLLSLIMVVYSYSAGFGSLMWVLNAELFDDKSRAIGMGVAGLTSTLFMFLATKYFASLTSAIGPAYTYWLFSIFCILVCLFFLFCIPETKGKSFAEIQDSLRSEKNEQSKESKEKC